VKGILENILTGAFLVFVIVAWVGLPIACLTHTTTFLDGAIFVVAAVVFWPIAVLGFWFIGDMVNNYKS
jgi:hypothetical protein